MSFRSEAATSSACGVTSTLRLERVARNIGSEGRVTRDDKRGL